jgi:hypothetical protein
VRSHKLCAVSSFTGHGAALRIIIQQNDTDVRGFFSSQHNGRSCCKRKVLYMVIYQNPLSLKKRERGWGEGVLLLKPEGPPEGPSL